MQDIRVDEDGNQRCWKCGGKNFTQKRTFRAKAIGVPTVVVGALATKKKLQCQSFGEYNDVGNAKPWDGLKDEGLAQWSGTWRDNSGSKAALADAKHMDLIKKPPKSYGVPAASVAGRLAGSFELGGEMIAWEATSLSSRSAR